MTDVGGMNPAAIDPAMGQIGMQQQQLKPGTMPGFTQPFSAKPLAKPVYFFMTMRNHHMYRADGKRILFVNQVHEALDEEDAKYLLNEINAKIPYLRMATDAEIEMFRMFVDPKGTITAQVKAEVEQQTRDKLSAELANMAASLQLTDEQKAALAALTAKVETSTGAQAAELNDLAKINGITKGGETPSVVQSGTGKVIIGPNVAQPRSLAGIAGTDKMATAGVSGA